MDADKTGEKCSSRRSKVQIPLHESCIRREEMRRLFSLNMSVYRRSSAVKRLTNHERLPFQVFPKAETTIKDETPQRAKPCTRCTHGRGEPPGWDPRSPGFDSLNYRTLY